VFSLLGYKEWNPINPEPTGLNILITW
jgi:hypothetical protein